MQEVTACHRLRLPGRDESPSTWVLWIHASSAVRLEQSVRTNLDDLKVPDRADPGANLFQLLRDWLQDSKHGKWLLVLDNVDDAQSGAAGDAQVAREPAAA